MGENRGTDAPIRVLLADHTMFREGLARILAAYGGMEVVAEATVKRHLANVYEKMGVGSRGEAARMALLRDWITIEEVRQGPPGDAGS